MVPYIPHMTAELFSKGSIDYRIADFWPPSSSYPFNVRQTVQALYSGINQVSEAVSSALLVLAYSPLYQIFNWSIRGIHIGKQFFGTPVD